MTNGNDFVDTIGDLDNHDGGLTKREYFAAMAMQGLIAASGSSSGSVAFHSDSNGEWAVQCADDLIAALNQPAPEGTTREI